MSESTTPPGATTPLTNDGNAFEPRTEFDGPALAFDFPGLEVGIAEYAEGPTGCTVFHFLAGAQCAIDKRGGAVGLTGDYEFVHAICLAGGSLYGLEAASGVTAELWERRNYSTAWDSFALVSGAIVYDYGRRSNSVYPDKALGRAAMRAARAGSFPLGSRGAGRSVRVGSRLDWSGGERSGQGGAFREIGPVKLAVFCVVNALGAVHDRQGLAIRGHRDASTGARLTAPEDLDSYLAAETPNEVPVGNTTLTVVITNLTLSRFELVQTGRQVHSSMARAIQPFHTMNDGDVLYMVSTGAVEHPRLVPAALGIAAAELAWDAVLASIPADG